MQVVSLHTSTTVATLTVFGMNGRFVHNSEDIFRNTKDFNLFDLNRWPGLGLVLVKSGCLRSREERRYVWLRSTSRPAPIGHGLRMH